MCLRSSVAGACRVIHVDGPRQRDCRPVPRRGGVPTPALPSALMSCFPGALAWRTPPPRCHGTSWARASLLATPMRVHSAAPSTLSWAEASSGGGTYHRPVRAAELALWCTLPCTASGWRAMLTLPCAMADILANLAGDTLCAQPPMRVCPHIGPGLGFHHHAPAERWPHVNAPPSSPGPA
jgi:hypothetical protein